VRALVEVNVSYSTMPPGVRCGESTEQIALQVAGNHHGLNASRGGMAVSRHTTSEATNRSASLAAASTASTFTSTPNTR
jgi:hypothetical protein